MDIVWHEERLIASGFKVEQAREILRLVTSGDPQAMTNADGERLEQRLSVRIDRLDIKIDALSARVDA